MAVISWPQAPLSAGNLSVFSGISPDVNTYTPKINGDHILATIRKKHIAMMWCSDGDNIGYLMHRGFGRFRWEDVTQQESSFGWTINPTLANIAPLIWNYYTSTRNKTSLVCAFSGAGYTYPRMMDEKQLEDYISYTATALQHTGLQTIAVDHRGGGEGPWNNALATHYNTGLKETDFLGTMFGSGGPSWGMHFSYSGVPSPAVRPAYPLESGNIENIVNDIISRNTDSTFINLGSNYPWHNGQVINDDQAFGGEAIFFPNTSSGYKEIIIGPYIHLAPGQYSAKFRLKISNNQSATDFLNISISKANYSGINSELTGFTELTHKSVAPNLFTEADGYQLIEIPFNCEEFVSNLEMIVSYVDSGAEITADYISIKDMNPSGLPVFAPVFINVLSADEIADLPRLFTEQFEDSGGIVLTPEEFLAALNPEYMIDFAIAILGPGEPQIAQAKIQFSEGNYFSSLITIRNALKEVSNVEILHDPSVDFELEQNYPNPFNQKTIIKFTLPKADKVRIIVYSSQGEEIAILLDRSMSAGYHEITYNAPNMQRGVYLYYLEAGTLRKVKKMVYY